MRKMVVLVPLENITEVNVKIYTLGAFFERMKDSVPEEKFSFFKKAIALSFESEKRVLIALDNDPNRKYFAYFLEVETCDNQKSLMTALGELQEQREKRIEREKQLNQQRGRGYRAK